MHWGDQSGSGRGQWLLCLLVALLCILPASAAPRKRSVLILTPGLTAPSLFQELQSPRWSGLRSSCGMAAMNAQSPTPVDLLSGYATIGAGTRVRWSPGRAEPGGPAAGGLARAVGSAGERIAYLGPANRGVTPWEGRPAWAVSLSAFQAEAIAQGSGGDLPALVRLLDRNEVVVYDLPAPSEALPLLEQLVARLDPQRDQVLLTSPAPGEVANGQWKALAGFLMWAPGAAGRSLTSSTTRTPGLVSNIDVAPTILQHLGLSIPPAMTGHPIRAEQPARVDQLLSFAADRRAVRDLMTPGLIAWGAAAFLACAWALVTLLRPGPPGAALIGRVLLALPINLASAMLLSTLGDARTAAWLAVRITATGFLMTALAAAWMIRPSAPGSRRSTPLLLALVTGTALILGDLFLRLGMLQENLLSDFANIGARFYGIGNEWEGLLLGATLVLPYWIAELRPGAHPDSQSVLSPPERWIAAVLWGATLVGVAAPMLGADFGGAVTFTLAYGVSAAVLGAPGADPKRRVRRLLGALAVAAAVAGGLVLLDTLRPPGARTHVGELAARALHGEWSPVWEMVGRKVALNVETALSAYTMGGLLAAAPLLWLCYSRLGPAAKDLFAHRRALRAGLLSAVTGGLLGLILNDTGVVTWAMATGCALLVFLDAMLGEKFMVSP